MRTSFVQLVLLCFVLVPRAFADEAKPTLLVLDIEPKGAPPLQGEAATQSVVRGLRLLEVFQVLSSEDVRELLAMERNRQLLGVSGEEKGIGEIGKVLGARHAVAGSLTKASNQLTVEIRLLDTVTNQVLSQKDLGPMTSIDRIASDLPGLAQELVGPLLREQQGSLLVKSREEAAEVLVDDVLVGSTPLKVPLVLPRGMHRLQVRKDGFVAQAKTVRIEPEQLSVEEVTLSPSADYAEAYRLRHGRLRVGAYIATGVAVGALLGGLLLDRNSTEPLYQSEFLPRRKALEEPPNPEELFTGDPKARAAFDECRENFQSCAATTSDLNNRIRTQQIISISLVAVGLVAAGTATYLWLTGEDPNRYANLVAGVSAGKEPSAAFAFSF